MLATGSGDPLALVEREERAAERWAQHRPTPPTQEDCHEAAD
jgi:hypothetical protein